MTNRLLANPGVTRASASATTATVLAEFFSPGVAASALPGGRRRRRRRGARRGTAPCAADWPEEDGVTVPPWHAMTAAAAARRLRTSPEAGLDPQEAARRLASLGPNEIPHVKPRSPLAIFADQLVSLPVGLLAGSAALSLMTGGMIDAAVIAAVVLLNAGVATATEHRAERTIRSLSDYAPQPVPALRGGARVLLDPTEIVCGDILLLERGMLIPADARLISCADFSVNELALTGEAVPARKAWERALPAETVLPERRNMLYRGTAVTGGCSAALVTATGGATEIGRIQRLLGALRPPATPMQRQLYEVERELIVVSALVGGGSSASASIADAASSRCSAMRSRSSSRRSPRACRPSPRRRWRSASRTCAATTSPCAGSTPSRRSAP